MGELARAHKSYAVKPKW